MPDPNEVLRGYSNDLLELERRTLDMTKDYLDLEEVRRYSEVQRLVTRIRETIGRHADELHRAIEPLGGEGSSWLKQAMSSVAGAATGMITKVEGSEKGSKVLRNNYAALDAAALGALMLYTTALAFNNGRISEVSGRHFDELTSLAIETRELIPTIVLKEFADQGYTVNTTVTEEVNRKTQQAWGVRAAL